MTTRLDRTALHVFLSELVLSERALAKQYQRAEQRCDDADLKVSMANAADDAERRADGVELLLSDLGMDTPAALPLPPVIAAVTLEGTLRDSNARMARYHDTFGLLMAEEWRRAAVSCLHAVAEVTHNERLSTAAVFLDEQSTARIAWLRGLTACFGTDALAPQRTGTPLPPHPQPPAMRQNPQRMHEDEFTHGPDATPV